jgi:3-methyladenine DNA glycosylase Mpg
MAIYARYDGVDLCTDRSLWLGTSDSKYHGAVAASTRIGLSRATSKRWRFYERGSAAGQSTLNCHTKAGVSILSGKKNTTHDY